MTRSRKTYYSNRGTHGFGVYESTRWSSYSTRKSHPDAWYADGGANDEGYNYRHCLRCSDTTEHDLTECLQCGSINK